MKNVMGSIYLLCFNEPFKHAKHYTGWTTNLTERLELHLQGRGAKLLAAVAEAGIAWELASVIPGDRNLERRLKQHSATRRCPICQSKEVTPMHDEKNWQNRAACRNVDPEIFFPLGDVWQSGEASAAKAVCWGCPVSWQCLASAIVTGDGWSVAGGMTPAERRALRAQQAA